MNPGDGTDNVNKTVRKEFTIIHHDENLFIQICLWRAIFVGSPLKASEVPDRELMWKKVIFVSLFVFYALVTFGKM